MERIILNQENHSVKEIYQDFYMFLAEHFTPLGYKYRKSKHDMYKNIENFKNVKLALGLGAISLEIPILIPEITKAVEQTNLQALSGKQYLEVLSDNLEKVAEELYEEYQWHEEQNRIEQYYSDNLKIK